MALAMVKSGAKDALDADHRVARADTQDSGHLRIGHARFAGEGNTDRMSRAATSPNAIFNQRVVFGGINLSMVIGLASQDTAEQCIREVGLTNIKLSHPVFHGDTLYAYSEVLEATEDPANGGGLVRFRHYGVNQNRKLCVQAERTVLLRKRPGTPT